MGAPWQTSARASQDTFAPGDSLSFEAGATYGGLTLKGSGSWSPSTYESTFGTTHTADAATCLAGPNASQVLADATSSTDPDPSAWDDHYCRQIAKETAMPAGFTAADATAQWITVGRYGSGADPILDGGGTSDVGIDIHTLSSGGVLIQDLEISNFDRAGIHYTSPAVTLSAAGPTQEVLAAHLNGVLLRRLNIHHVRRLCTAYGVGVGTDCIVHPQGNGVSTGNWPAMAGFWSFHANGIALRSAGYVRVEDVQIDDTDGPYYFLYTRHLWADDLRAEHSYWEHPYVNVGTWGVFKNHALRDMCALGYPDGAATLFWAGTRDFTLRDSTLKRSTRPISPISGTIVNDGVSFDGEANMQRTLFDNVQACGAGVDGCDGHGWAFIAGATTYPQHDMLLVMNSTVLNYTALGASDRIGTLVGVSGAIPTQQGRGLFIRNTFTPHSPGIGVNSAWLSTPPSVFVRPAGWYEHLNVLNPFVADNDNAQRTINLNQYATVPRRRRRKRGSLAA